MKELLTYIAQNLVEHPEQVSVSQFEDEGETVLELRVAPEDMGKVIGRQGRIAKEIRTLVRSVAQRVGEGKLFIVAHCPCFWDDFTENQNQQRQDTSTDTDSGISPYTYDKGGHKGGGADIHNIVAN